MAERLAAAGWSGDDSPFGACTDLGAQAKQAVFEPLRAADTHRKLYVALRWNEDAPDQVAAAPGPKGLAHHFQIFLKRRRRRPRAPPAPQGERQDAKREWKMLHEGTSNNVVLTGLALRCQINEVVTFRIRAIVLLESGEIQVKHQDVDVRVQLAPSGNPESLECARSGTAETGHTGRATTASTTYSLDSFEAELSNRDHAQLSLADQLELADRRILRQFRAFEVTPSASKAITWLPNSTSSKLDTGRDLLHFKQQAKSRIPTRAARGLHHLELRPRYSKAERFIKGVIQQNKKRARGELARSKHLILGPPRRPTSLRSDAPLKNSRPKQQARLFQRSGEEEEGEAEAEAEEGNQVKEHESKTFNVASRASTTKPNMAAWLVQEFGPRGEATIPTNKTLLRKHQRLGQDSKTSQHSIRKPRKRGKHDTFRNLFPHLLSS